MHIHQIKGIFRKEFRYKGTSRKTFNADVVVFSSCSVSNKNNENNTISNRCRKKSYSYEEYLIEEVLIEKYRSKLNKK